MNKDIIRQSKYFNIYFNLYSDQIIKFIICTTKDIYENRSILKSVRYNHNTFKHILDIVLKAERDNKRYRKYECLNTIKRMIKYNQSDFRNNILHDESTITKLTNLFQYFVINYNDVIASLVNYNLIGLSLNERFIKWLIENHDKSKHILNRIIKYPFENEQINTWAKTMYLSGQYSERKSEIIGILIKDCVPKFIDEDYNTIAWGIYYSKCTIEKKETLLLKYLNPTSVDSVYEIGSRIESSKVLNKLGIYINELINKE